MKILNTQQYEKLKIRAVNINDIKINYQPKTRVELDKLLKSLIDERGANGDFNDIDVSEISDFSSLFYVNCNEFNGNISRWNMSKAIDISAMFFGCHKFNCDISKWDVSNVKYMSNTFIECITFNQPLNDWNVSNVRYMDEIFRACIKFNQPLDKWYDKLENVINMGRMFFDCFIYNQDLSSWKIDSKKTSTYKMFEGADKMINKHMPSII